jgi:hypothetical protein
MAGDEPRSDAGTPGEPEIAAADLLFRDEPAHKPTKPTKPPGPAAPGAGSGGGETFDLADSPFVESHAESEAPAIPPVRSTEPPSARTRDTAGPRTARTREPSAAEDEALVDEVWSRGAEWGPNLVILAAWLFTTAVVVYFLMGWEAYGLGFMALLAGAAGAVVLSYPILITLERPVRITPEQAVRDYYGALSHHLPHYRRMWLLLARTGRTSSSYGSFEGFKAYWTDKLKTIKGDRVGTFTPLVFEVDNFRGEKSSGKSRVEVKFTLKISIRGQRKAGPIASIPGQISLARGPDKMWYLESGTLPRAHQESDSA